MRQRTAFLIKGHAWEVALAGAVPKTQAAPGPC